MLIASSEEPLKQALLPAAGEALVIERVSVTKGFLLLPPHPPLPLKVASTKWAIARAPCPPTPPPPGRRPVVCSSRSFSQNASLPSLQSQCRGCLLQEAFLLCLLGSSPWAEPVSRSARAAPTKGHRQELKQQTLVSRNSGDETSQTKSSPSQFYSWGRFSSRLVYGPLLSVFTGPVLWVGVHHPTPTHTHPPPTPTPPHTFPPTSPHTSPHSPTALSPPNTPTWGLLVSLFTRTPILSDQRPPLQPHLTLITSLGGPSPNQPPPRLRASTSGFGSTAVSSLCHS